MTWHFEFKMYFNGSVFTRLLAKVTVIKYVGLVFQSYDFKYVEIKNITYSLKSF
jgi:hypothetical protein